MSKLAPFWLLFCLVLPPPFLLAVPSTTGGGIPESRFGFAGLEMYKYHSQIFFLNVLDIDKDGLSDLALVNNANARIEFLFQERAGNANGVPAARRETDPEDLNEIAYDGRLKKESLITEKKVNSLGFLDVTGDGRLDIVFSGDPREIVVAAQGAGRKFEIVQRIPFEQGVTEISVNNLCVGPFPYQGHPSVLAIRGKTSFFLFAPERGALAQVAEIPISKDILEAGVIVFNLADLNGDGHSDLVYLVHEEKKNLRIRPGGATEFGPELAFDIPESRFFRCADLDSDGRAEILVLTRTTGRALVFNLTEESPEVDFLSLEYYPLAPVERAGRRVFLLGGEPGFDRFLVAGHTAAGELQGFFPSPGRPGTFSPPRVSSAYNGIRNLAEWPDPERKCPGVVVLSEEEKLLGRARFVGGRFAFPERILGFQGIPLALAHGRVDAGPIQDLVLLAMVDEKPRLYVARDGLTEFQPWSTPDFKAARVLHLLCGDFNGDDLGDLLVLAAFEPPLVLLQGPEKSFRIPTNWKENRGFLPENLSAARIALLDRFECPALSKLKGAAFFTHLNYGRLFSLGRDDEPLFHDQFNVRLPAFQATTGAFFQSTASAPPCLALYDEFGGFLARTLIPSDGPPRELAPIQVGKLSDARALALASFPEKGRDSLLLAGTDRFVILRPAARRPELKHRFTYESTTPEGKLWNGLAGDLNNDGRVDLIFAESQKNALEFTTPGEGGKLECGLKFPMFESKQFKNRVSLLSEPRLMAQGDLNGDGLNDLVFLIHDRVLIYFQDGEGRRE